MTQTETHEKIIFAIEKSRRHLAGISEEEYLEQRTRETEIATHPKARTVPTDDVVQDLQRYGSRDSGYLAKAFLENTMLNRRTGSVAGRDGKVVYLAVGDYVHGDQFELGLVSAHIPGSSGGVGWGMNGIRRLVIAKKENHSQPLDPEQWLKNTVALAEETYNGKTKYRVVGGPSARTLLYIAVERSKCEKAKE